MSLVKKWMSKSFRVRAQTSVDIAGMGCGCSPRSEKGGYSRDVLCRPLLRRMSSKGDAHDGLEKQEEDVYRSLLFVYMHLPRERLSSQRKVVCTSHSAELSSNLQTIFGVGNLNHLQWTEEERVKPMKTLSLSATVVDAVLAWTTKPLPDVFCVVTTRRPSKGHHSRFGSLGRRNSFTVPNAHVTSLIEGSREPRWDQTFYINIDEVESEELEVLVWRKTDGSQLLQKLQSFDPDDPAQITWFCDLMSHVYHNDAPSEFVGMCRMPLKQYSLNGECHSFDLTTRPGYKGKRVGIISIKLTLVYKESVGEQRKRDSVDGNIESNSGQFNSVDLYCILYRKIWEYQERNCIERGEDMNLSLEPQCQDLLDTFASTANVTDLQRKFCHLCILLDEATDPITSCVLSKQTIVHAIEDCCTAWANSTEQAMFLARLSNDMLEYFEIVVEKICSLVLDNEEPDLMVIFPPDDDKLTRFKQCLGTSINLLALQSDIATRCGGRVVTTSLPSMIRKLVEDNVTRWIRENLPEEPDPTNTEAVLHELTTLRNLFDLMTTFVQQSGELREYFMTHLAMDYLERAVVTFDKQLSTSTKAALRSIDEHNAAYKKLPENLAQTGTASLRLHISLGRFMEIVRDNLDERNMFKLSLTNYPAWFVRAYGYWLDAYKALGNKRLANCLRLEKDIVEVHHLVKISQSVVNALEIFSQVIGEWKDIHVADPLHYVMGLVKITDFICDGSRAYTSQLVRATEHNTLCDKSGRTFDVTDQLCITLNNMERVRDFLDNLETRMNWTEATLSAAEYVEVTEVAEQYLTTLHRLVDDAQSDVMQKSHELEFKIACRLECDINKRTRRFTQDGSRHTSSIDGLLVYLRRNLITVGDKLEESLRPRMVRQVWKSVVAAFATNLQLGESPEYYDLMQRNLEALVAYFYEGGLTSADLDNEKYYYLCKTLENNFISTESLLLSFYAKMSETKHLPSSTPENGHYGVVTVKFALCAKSPDYVTLYVKVIDARNLPGVDRTGLSDPYVKVNLQPNNLFSQYTTYKTKVVEQTLWPEYNQMFTFDDIPADRLRQPGTVVHIRVLDRNTIISDELLGETFLPLSRATALINGQIPDGVHAVILPLGRPNQPPPNKPFQYHIIESRASWDPLASNFIRYRGRAQRDNLRHRTRDPCQGHPGVNLWERGGIGTSFRERHATVRRPVRIAHEVVDVTQTVFQRVGVVFGELFCRDC